MYQIETNAPCQGLKLLSSRDLPLSFDNFFTLGDPADLSRPAVDDLFVQVQRDKLNLPRTVIKFLRKELFHQNSNAAKSHARRKQAGCRRGEIQ